MARWLKVWGGLIAVLVGLAVFRLVADAMVSPPPPLPEYEVRVICPLAYQQFTGSLSAHAADGASNGRSVEGAGEARYPLGRSRIVSVNFQKKTEGDWRLTVELYRDGALVKTEQTTAEYGLASIAEAAP